MLQNTCLRFWGILACFIAFSIITTLSAKDQENPNCCSSNTWVRGCWGEGTAYGDPFVLIRAVFKPGEVGMSWLGGHAKHSLPSVGQQDLLEPPHSSACNTSHALETSQGLHQPQQWSFCGRRWSGRKEKVWVSSPETPVEQQSLRWLELWAMLWPPPPPDHQEPPECLPPPWLHPYCPQEHQRVTAGCITPTGKLHPN